MGHDLEQIEIKSETNVDESNTDVSEAVAAALDGIRTDVVGRLEALETKSADFAKRLSRPAIIPAPAEAPEAIEKKAFVNYLRHGREAMTVDEIKTLTVATGTAGGFLAPQEFGAELLKKIVEYSPIREFAHVVSTSAPSITYPRGVSNLGATWVSETGARTGSEPTFEQVTLTPYELATYVDVSTALLEDNAYNLEGELALQFAQMFGKTEGAAFVVGTGTGQPKGLLSAAGIAEVKTGAASAFPASNPDSVLMNLFHAVPTVVSKSAVWLMNRKTMNTIRQFKDGMGRSLLVDPLSSTAPSTILGRPIVEAADMPDIGAGTYPIVFGDLQGFRIVDRVDLQTLRDPYTLAAVGQVRIHARKRVGSDVTHPDRFAKLKVSA